MSARYGSLLLLAWLTAVQVPGLTAQEEAGDAAPEEVTEVDRILRITRVIELDEERLRELREEMVEKDDFLTSMAALVRETEDELIEVRTELAGLEPGVEPGVREELQVQVERLATDLELFKTQTELEFDNVMAHRDSIAALEKKLERERRTLEYLKTGGGVPDEPPAGGREPAGEAAPGASNRLPIPGFPALPTGEAPAAAVPVEVPETAALIAARRRVERARQEVREAEYALVEFVKRRESLELQIGNERKLISTVEGSRANLERAIGVYETGLAKESGAGGDPELAAELERRIEQVGRFLDATILEVEKRKSYVASLAARLEKLDLEEQTLSRAVEEARSAEEAAVRATAWLQSPLHPANVARWAAHRGPRILLVLSSVIVLLVLVRLSMRRMARLAVRKGQGRRTSTPTNRADTLAFSFKSAATMLIVIVGALLILQEAGVDVKTVLGGAAILGVAVAFGAQNLMKDYFSGFMILLEVAQELRDDSDFEGWVTDEPTMLGVDKFTEAGTIIKFMVQTRPDKIFPTRRELLRRVKNRFDEEGIEISVPHRRLLRSSEEAG